MNDSKVKSMIRGRYGAAILSLVAFLAVTFGLTGEQTQTATTMVNQSFDWIIQGATLLAGVMAFFSKMREK